MIINENPAFISFDNSSSGLIFDDKGHKFYPIAYYNVRDGKSPEIKSNCSYYGYIYEGVVQINKAGTPPILLSDGMYFSLTGSFNICKGGSGHSAMILIEVEHEKGVYPETKYSAYDSFGGPIESHGRLKYIDGCTDSLLISPVKMGNPCLNHLHFPSNIDQTQHTHPSHRIGIVAKGEGMCITPFGELPLTKGMIFVIKEDNGRDKTEGLDGKLYPFGQHAFKTENSSMDVIAFHPDSDFGATDTEHPMINRTIVEGVSASKLTKIQTK
jgi:hypothetical protein